MSAAAVMLPDSSRVQRSAAFAFSVHAAILGLFFVHQLRQHKETEIRLREVEFIDLKPAPVASLPQSAPAAQLPPRGIRDFLRMALPQFPKPQQAAQPQEAKIEKDSFRDMKLPQQQSLVDKGQINRQPDMKLDAKLERGPQANLGEISKVDAPRDRALAALEPPKSSIALDAVGRRAVRVAGPAIRIDGAAGPARANMADFPTSPTAKTVSGPAAPSAAGIDLKEGAPLNRGRAAMPSTPVIGYGKGSGGISLAERPGTRAAAAIPQAPAPAAPKPQAELAQAANSKKAVEISGPLAGRKVLSIVMPAYPEWARAKGVEADVSIRFFVGPDGLVLDRKFIERTSGYKELDDLCKEALDKIKFVPLPAGSKEEQWGVITFRFRLT